MKNFNTMRINKLSLLLAFLFIAGTASGQIELTYEGTEISNANQTSTFAPEVTPTQADGVLTLDIIAIPDQNTIYTIELTDVIDISEDANIFGKLGSDASMMSMGVKLVDINENQTTGNTNRDIFYLPGVEGLSLHYSFNNGVTNPASVQPELTTHGVDNTQIKKIVFFNNSGAEFTGKIWFENLQLGTEATDNGVTLTDSTFSATFNGKRIFGNGLTGIGMDNNGRVGIVQDDELFISINDRLNNDKYIANFIFDQPLDLSKGNAVFDLKMKTDIEVTVRFRFEDVNGKRVDLVDIVPAITDNMEQYQFDVNNRFISNPDFDPSQIKYFQIRKIPAEVVNGTFVIDNLRIGIPYLSLYENNYEGVEISDATQTSSFAPEVTPTQTDGVLTLDITAIPDQNMIYKIALTDYIDISEDPNIFAKIGSDTKMQSMGVKLVDIHGNQTTGNSNRDIFYLPGVADKSLYYSFSNGAKNQASVQPEIDANGVDNTQIKEIIFFNNSGAEFTGQIWFENLQLGTEATDNGVTRTDSTFSAPFDGKRMFGNGLTGIGMDNNSRVGIVQDEELFISINDRLLDHKYMTVFIFDPLLDLSKGNAIFDLKMKSDVEVTVLFRFEDVNGQRVDLVDVVPEITDNMQKYHFDVNNRFFSNPSFDPSQIKEFHIRKLSAEGVNGTVVIDDLNLGIPYFNRYENTYEASEISDATQTSTFAPEVSASQTDGVLELDITNLADQSTFYMIEFDRPLDISEDPNIWAKIKSDAEMKFMGVRLVDSNDNSTTGTSNRDKMHLPGVSDKFLNYSFSEGAKVQMGVQSELTANNVDSTSIKKLIFFNNSGAEFTGKIWFDHLRLGTESGNNGVELTETSFYAPFNGERTFGNGLKAVGMDHNGRIGIAQDDVLHVSVMEGLVDHKYLTVFVFENTLDLSGGNSNIMFEMKSDVEFELLLRYEDVDGQRVDLHSFTPTVSEDFVTYAFDLNNRFFSNPSFNPELIREFHFRKLSPDPVNGNLVIDNFKLGFADDEAPEAPADLEITAVTDSTATLKWEEPYDNYGVHKYNIYVNGALHDSSTNPQITLSELSGTLTFTVTALDRAGNESGFSNEVTAVFSTNIENVLSPDDISIYPNPISSLLNIQSNHSIDMIRIYSVSGVMVKEYHPADKLNVVNLNTTSLSTGVYLLKVITEKGIIVKKLLKE